MIITDNLRTKELIALAAPATLIAQLQASKETYQLVTDTRQAIESILTDKDDRLVVIVGPCSIHDPQAALAYAQRLVTLREQYKDELCIIMRVYFEKPRTTVGWKGLINDPYLNDSFAINDGLKLARQLLIDINALGLPTATEFLDTIIPQYIADLISWAAIGARTTESQIHREMTSGLSMPVGFKNGTQGNLEIAIDAISAASQPHHFLGVSKEGKAAIISTTGNSNCHVILRGGKQTGPNYTAEHVNNAATLLNNQHVTPKVMVDCSHGNSQKDHTKQHGVLENVCQQVLDNDTIFGVMVESNIEAGNQPLSKDKPLIFGKSITDACIGWDDTETAMALLANTVKSKRESKQ
ncbi:MAG: 3-deoxy-7-phosphoheptulonate synthase [Coxiella sp. (in: Bacteria)]|nr:MAG: 3-deoxy-7-phosphoheptulonate synthase [Coxiella sp. (in: g-proteobacteria)]